MDIWGQHPVTLGTKARAGSDLGTGLWTTVDDGRNPIWPATCTDAPLSPLHSPYNYDDKTFLFSIGTPDDRPTPRRRHE